VLFSLLGQFLIRLANVDAAAAERSLALRTVENELERVAAALVRDGQLPTLPSQKIAIPELSDGRLAVEIGSADHAGFAPVTLSLVWRNSAQEWNEPISLTAWLPAPKQIAAEEPGP
jgi:hypothetical protein